MNWYVIKTKPKREQDVFGQLRRAAYELFYPQIQGDASYKPLFPSYLFIRTNFEDCEHYRLVRFTRGVSYVLCSEEGPVPVPPDVITTLQERTRDGSLIEQTLLFKEGDPVRVRRGILKDLTGIIEKQLPATKRVGILFKWLNKNVRAVLRYRDLERVS